MRMARRRQPKVAHNLILDCQQGRRLTRVGKNAGLYGMKRWCTVGGDHAWNDYGIDSNSCLRSMTINWHNLEVYIPKQEGSFDNAFGGD